MMALHVGALREDHSVEVPLRARGRDRRSVVAPREEVSGKVEATAVGSLGCAPTRLGQDEREQPRVLLAALRASTTVISRPSLSKPRTTATSLQKAVLNQASRPAATTLCRGSRRVH